MQALSADRGPSGLPAEILRAIDSMPAISPVLGKINAMSRQMETSPRDLVRVIMLDPTLTGKVLKLVNSSFYGLSRRVQTLAQAVVYLGVNTVRNLAISTAVLSTVFMREKRSPLDPEAFWRHCLATAVGSRLLAGRQRMSAEEVETCFIAGLLHDVGKILLIRTDPARYSMVLHESRQLGVTLEFAELAHFGVTHCQAGGALAQHWQLDRMLTGAIAHHHDQCPDVPTGLVAVANTLAKELPDGDSGNRIAAESIDDLTDTLGCAPGELQSARERVPQEVARAAEFLSYIREGSDT